MSAITKFFERFATVANTRISARASTEFMKPGAKVRSAEERAQFYPNPRTGVGTLRRMSGRLVSSITGTDFRGDREEIFNVKITGSTVEIEKGTKTPYAGAHEYGFTGSVTVPAHERTITQAFGRPIEPKKVQVRSYIMNQNISPRPYLKPAIDKEERFLLNWLSDNFEPIIIQEVGING